MLQSLKGEIPMPPEVRTSQISSAGELYLSFTKEMVVPGNFTDILNVRSVPRKSTDTESVKDQKSEY